MTSKIWPAPTDAERAIAAATNELEDGNDVDEDEDDCEEHEYCATCEECLTCSNCECAEVYVYYATHVVVTVDWEGDVTSVVVNCELTEPYDVQFEDGERVPDGPLRTRALTSVREQDWPNWDFS
jgi:hypothetical protein